ncbi:hypothetical protein D9M68_714360 [compost metagenome]
MRQVVDVRQQGGEGLAIVDHAAHRDTAEADAVVAQLAADQAGAGALADGALVGEGDLQGGVRRFRAGVGEEHFVQALGRDVCQALGQLEGQGMAHLEGRREIQLGDLPAHRFGDFSAAVASVAAPEAGGTVEHLVSVAAGEEHPFGAFQQARIGLELAVGGEGHPEVIETVGNSARLRRVAVCHCGHQKRQGAVL